MSAGSRTVLVAGGAGEVGEGIVRAFLDQGWRVVVPSRSAERLDALRRRVAEGDRLHVCQGEIGEPQGAQTLAARIDAEVGELDAVVASLGGWWDGKRVVDVEPELWRRLLDDSLTAHFVVARTFLPRLAQRSGAS